MKRRSPFASLCVLVAMLSSVLSPITSAARLFVDSRPTNADPSETNHRLIFREMPRQALIVAATQDFGVTCIDPTSNLTPRRAMVISASD